MALNELSEGQLVSVFYGKDDVYAHVGRVVDIESTRVLIEHSPVEEPVWYNIKTQVSLRSVANYGVKFNFMEIRRRNGIKN